MLETDAAIFGTNIKYYNIKWEYFVKRKRLFYENNVIVLNYKVI